MSAKDLPLRRFKVLDLTRARAGPTAVRQLADWGAEVLKIEAPAENDARSVTAGCAGMGSISRTCTATSARSR